MKPYNADATCPKCGHDDIVTAHVRKGRRSYSQWQNGAPDGREFLSRHCRRCHFEWYEDCLKKDRLTCGPSKEQ